MSGVDLNLPLGSGRFMAYEETNEMEQMQSPTFLQAHHKTVSQDYSQMIGGQQQREQSDRNHQRNPSTLEVESSPEIFHGDEEDSPQKSDYGFYNGSIEELEYSRDSPQRRLNPVVFNASQTITPRESAGATWKSTKMLEDMRESDFQVINPLANEDTPSDRGGLTEMHSGRFAENSKLLTNFLTTDNDFPQITEEDQSTDMKTTERPHPDQLGTISNASTNRQISSTNPVSMSSLAMAGHQDIQHHHHQQQMYQEQHRQQQQLHGRLKVPTLRSLEDQLHQRFQLARITNERSLNDISAVSDSFNNINCNKKNITYGSPENELSPERASDQDSPWSEVAKESAGGRDKQSFSRLTRLRGEFVDASVEEHGGDRYAEPSFAQNADISMIEKSQPSFGENLSLPTKQVNRLTQRAGRLRLFDDVDDTTVEDDVMTFQDPGSAPRQLQSHILADSPKLKKVTSPGRAMKGSAHKSPRLPKTKGTRSAKKLKTERSIPEFAKVDSFRSDYRRSSTPKARGTSAKKVKPSSASNKVNQSFANDNQNSSRVNKAYANFTNLYSDESRNVYNLKMALKKIDKENKGDKTPIKSSRKATPGDPSWFEKAIPTIVNDRATMVKILRVVSSQMKKSNEFKEQIKKVIPVSKRKPLNSLR